MRRLLEGITDGDREKKRPPESAKGKTPGKRTVDESALWPFSSWVVGPDGLLQEAGSMFYKAPARGSFAEGFVER